MKPTNENVGSDIVCFGDRCYEVAKLWDYAKDLIICQRRVASFPEVNLVTWFTGENESGCLVIEIPTLDSLVHHYNRTRWANLRHPIILSPCGQIMDGMHRLAKAKLLNKTYISYVQFDDWPPTDSQ